MTKTQIAIIVMAALALPLVGCTVKNPGKPSVNVALPKTPAYYTACFNELTPAAERGKKLTRAGAVRLIAKLTVSDKRHTKCGRDFLKWYAVVRASYAGQA